MEQLTAWIGRPQFIAAMSVAVVTWISGNLLAEALGSVSWDAPPFA